jgi:hypothetical protein
MTMPGPEEQVGLVEIYHDLDSAPQYSLQVDGAGFLEAPALSSGVVEDEYAEKVR